MMHPKINAISYHFPIVPTEVCLAICMVFNDCKYVIAKRVYKLIQFTGRFINIVAASILNEEESRSGSSPNLKLFGTLCRHSLTDQGFLGNAVPEQPGMLGNDNCARLEFLRDFSQSDWVVSLLKPLVLRSLLSQNIILGGGTFIDPIKPLLHIKTVLRISLIDTILSSIHLNSTVKKLC